MITALRLRDFQVHKKLNVKLSKTVTTIVGPNDAGKSAILRALRWLAQNRQPKGVRLARYGSRSSSVELVVEGKRIRRSRTSTKNEYAIGSTKHRAFGKQPPAEVLSLLNLSPLSFQAQADPWFLFSLTAGEVSKQLNGIVDLSVVDKTLDGVSKLGRELRNREKVARERLTAGKKRVRELKPVEKASGQFELVQTFLATAALAVDRRDTLDELWQEAAAKRTRAERLDAFVVDGEDLLRLRQARRKTLTRVTELDDLQAQGRRLSREASAVPGPEQLTALELLVEEVRKTEANYAHLYKLVHAGKGLTADVDQAVKSLCTHSTKRSLEFRACPLCERKF